MGWSLVEKSPLSIVKLREKTLAERSLVFEDQSEEEIFYVNQIRAALSRFEACRKYNLSRSHGKSVKHEPKISRDRCALVTLV